VGHPLSAAPPGRARPPGRREARNGFSRPWFRAGRRQGVARHDAFGGARDGRQVGARGGDLAPGRTPMTAA